MVDCAALEMLCTARYRGFESLPLRQLDISLGSRAGARAGDRARLTGGMRTLGSVRPSAEQAILQDWGKAPERSRANPSLSASWIFRFAQGPEPGSGTGLGVPEG